MKRLLRHFVDQVGLRLPALVFLVWWLWMAVANRKWWEIVATACFGVLVTHAFRGRVRLAPSRTRVESRWYHQATIKLDGYCFSGCQFDACTLWYETPDYELTECAFVNGSTIRGADPSYKGPS
jgi:hypothetical protein